MREHPELVRRYFMTQAVRPEEGKFALMHAAFWRGGTFLYVPRNVRAAAPLHNALWAVGGRTFTHTLVVLEEGAEAVFIDEYASETGDEPALHNGVVELLVGDAANLIYVSLQDFGTNTWMFTHERGRVGRDARLDWVISVMGTRLTKSFQTTELDGPGGWGRMSGLFFANGRQHFDLDTQQNHNAPDTVSDLLYKGALKDKGRSVWQGMIKALPDSQRIDGFQANRNLLLEPTARATRSRAWRLKPTTCDVPRIHGRSPGPRRDLLPDEPGHSRRDGDSDGSPGIFRPGDAAYSHCGRAPAHRRANPREDGVISPQISSWCEYGGRPGAFPWAAAVLVIGKGIGGGYDDEWLRTARYDREHRVGGPKPARHG